MLLLLPLYLPQHYGSTRRFLARACCCEKLMTKDALPSNLFASTTSPASLDPIFQVLAAAGHPHGPDP